MPKCLEHATLERWADDQEDDVAAGDEEVRCEVPPSLQTRHTYASMMLSAREHPMGRPADGAYGLDDDCAGLRTMDAYG